MLLFSYVKNEELELTRVNCIPAEHLLDEWVCAGAREGLRPLNNTRKGKYKSSSKSVRYHLGKGHELWLKDHLIFTVNQWRGCQKEWHQRGNKGFDFDVDFEGIPNSQLKGYTPDVKDYRHNLARLCLRFKNRHRDSYGRPKKKPTIYHLKGEPVDSYQKFKSYLQNVKRELGV